MLIEANSVSAAMSKFKTLVRKKTPASKKEFEALMADMMWYVDGREDGHRALEYLIVLVLHVDRHRQRKRLANVLGELGEEIAAIVALVLTLCTNIREGLDISVRETIQLHAVGNPLALAWR